MIQAHETFYLEEKKYQQRERARLDALVPDEKQVNEAVKFLREHEKDNLIKMRAVGKYLLETFFSGEIEKYRSSKPSLGSHSFNLLCKRCRESSKIGWRDSMIRNSMLLYARYRDDYRPWMDQISMSHQILLLSVNDPVVRDELANKAAAATSEKPYSRNDLARHIKELKRQNGSSSSGTRTIEKWKDRFQKKIELEFDRATRELSAADQYKLCTEILALVDSLKKSVAFLDPELHKGDRS